MIQRTRTTDNIFVIDEEAYDIPNDIHFIAGHHGGYHRVHHTAVVHRTHGHSYRGHHKVTLHVHLHVHHGYGGRKYTKYHGFKITHHGFIYRRVGKASLPQNDNNTHESTLKTQDGNIII